MGDQSNSTYSNILLENIDSDIPIALNFTTPPKVTQAEDNQVANELSTKESSSIISDTEGYVTTNLKQAQPTFQRRIFNVTQRWGQRQCPTLKQHRDNVDTKLFQRSLNIS